MRKFLLGISIILIIISFQGVLADGLTFTISEDATLGKVANITGYSGTIYNLTIPSTVSDSNGTYPVISIDRYAFRYRDDIQSVTFSESVTLIGLQAFFGCTSLSQVNLPDSLQTISCGAFGGCNGLRSIEIPAHIENILMDGGYSGVFRGCENLSTITFRSGITRIPEGIFANIPGLTAITIPNTVTQIDRYAFSGCSNLKNLNLSQNLISIGLPSGSLERYFRTSRYPSPVFSSSSGRFS